MLAYFDADMAKYVLVPFNLEAMKLSAYYKKHNQIVVLARNFEPERNEKFILRKDYNDGEFPSKINTYPNLEYGGYAFTDDIYVPLPPEIERCKPDTSLYTKMEKDFLLHGDTKEKRIFKTQMTAEHGRLSLDGKTIWGDYMRQFNYLPSARNLILHDRDLGAIDGGFEEVQKILSKARTDGWATKIGMKFPVNIYNGEDLLKWAGLNPDRTFFSLRYNGVVDDDVWDQYVLQCRLRAAYYNLEYWITDGDMTQQELCSNGLRRILRQVIIARSRRIHFSLKYTEDFFFDPRWENVIKFLQFYLSSMTGRRAEEYYSALPNDTAFDFARNAMNRPYRTFGPEAMNKNEIREIFVFVREHNYPLFRDFYECSLNSIEEEKRC